MLYAYIMTGRVATILQHLRSRLQALYGDRFTGVMLYGSHAREEASSESDIDVLIVLKGPVVRSQAVERTSHLVVGLCSIQAPGDRVRFAIDGLGKAALEVTR